MNKTVTVTLVRDGNEVLAVIGSDLKVGISGASDTAPEALRDLASAIERENWQLPELDAPTSKPVRVK